jgi:hypothetical protein
MDTMFLNPTTWDLDVDASSNIAMSSLSYAVAQDVASQSMLWQGEAPYNTADGIPYEQSVLGQRPAQATLAAWYRQEALRVPDVESATPVLIYDQARGVTGQIQVTLTDGTKVNV